MDNSKRNEILLQDAAERAKNFSEVSLGFTAELAMAEASRCLQCKTAPCRKGCPVAVNIPQFISCVCDNNLDGAVASIKASNNLPSVCGRVCPQERQCESLCIRKSKLGGSVAIGALERFVGDYALSQDTKPALIAKNGFKVAVIGSGPAGLTCAADCAMAGCEVIIFEAFHKMGGVLVYGIPEFRLPKEDVVQKEIDKLLALGVQFKLNTIIGKTILMDELLADYDAVFIGTGAGLPMFMNIKGENLNGVSSANEFLTRVNLMKAYKKDAATPVYCGKNVVVVGAGNVAMDAARTALRMGADNVYIIYRRSRDEMPARAEEIVHAEEEGVKFKLLTNPTEIIGDTAVSGIKCVEMELGQPDQSGRRKPFEKANSQFVLDCDQVIMSLGTNPNPLLKRSCDALAVNARGTIVVNEETMATSIENVYAGGDAVTGAATVILAMGAGKKAAKAIMEKLSKKLN